MTAESDRSELLSLTAPRPLGPRLPKTPTGIRGLDEITGGGLPRGRTTLVTGRAGSGKTLLGIQFLVAGARDYHEPGVLVTFEESREKVAANVASLGFDIAELESQNLLSVLSFEVDPSAILESGTFDFEPLFVMLHDAVQRVGAQRIVIDTVDVVFSAFRNSANVRADFARLVRWIEEHLMTGIVTGERGDGTVTRLGIEEYVTDCVISLDHRVINEISTRRLRVLKYRGSAHGTNEYPFMIGDRGFVVLPITSVSLNYPASEERVSTGIDRLDYMLSGGLYRGSTVLVSGSAGTGKSTISAQLIDAACRRGETGLLVLFEESPEQVLRNMKSVGMDLRRWVDAGLLTVWAARPSVFGLEAHLAMLSQLVTDLRPAVAVLDGISSLTHGPTALEVTTMVARQIDMLKSHGVTTMMTSILHEGEALGEGSGVGVSSLVDTWILLRNVEQDGERNRLLFLIKSRGTAHSNQVREFVLTGEGAKLLDVYVGPEGVLTGSARLVQEARAKEAAQSRREQGVRQRREMERLIAEAQMRIAGLEAEIAEHRAQIVASQTHAERVATELDADRDAMSAQRWADPLEE